MNDLITRFVGKEATVSMGGVIVNVLIGDVKNSYGRTRFLITPVKGSGEVWVESVKLVDGE